MQTSAGHCATGTAMTDCLATAGRNHSQTGELAMAAAEVVLRRMTLGGFAMVFPPAADHEEFARMVPEKTKAFADAGSILFSRSVQIGQAMTRFLVGETKHAAQAAAAVAICRNPGSLLAAQAGAALSWPSRVAVGSAAMCLLALEAQGAVLAPIHRAATENVQRLRN